MKQITNSMEHIPSWEANTSSVSHTFTTAHNLSLFWVRWIQPKPSHSISLRFISIVSSHLQSSHFRFSNQQPACIFPPQMCATCPAHLIFLYHTNNVWWRVKIIQLVIIHFSWHSCYFVLLRTKVSVNTYHDKYETNNDSKLNTLLFRTSTVSQLLKIQSQSHPFHLHAKGSVTYHTTWGLGLARMRTSNSISSYGILWASFSPSISGTSSMSSRACKSKTQKPTKLKRANFIIYLFIYLHSTNPNNVTKKHKI